jgi:TrmH family RNA methyltransferase
LLTSLANPLIKELLLLQKNRKDVPDKFVVEGVHLVEEVFSEGNLYAVEVIVFSEKFAAKRPSAAASPAIDVLTLACRRKIKTVEVSDKVFRKLSSLENPEGVLAVLKTKVFSFSELLGQRLKLCLLGVEIQDPGNLGTIFRSAEAFGVDCILLSAGSVDPFSGKVVRSSMGSILRLPVVQIGDAAVALDELKKHNFEIVAADAKRGEVLEKAYFNFPMVLVVGNEARGLPKDFVDNISKFVKIPMQGKVDSLNVGVATGVVLYAASRMKDKNPKS